MLKNLRTILSVTIEVFMLPVIRYKTHYIFEQLILISVA